MKVKCYKNNDYKGEGYGGYDHLHNEENSRDNEWVTSWCNGHYTIIFYNK